MQRIHAVFFHQGAPALGEATLRTDRALQALREAAAAHLSPAGQLQVATALGVLAALEARREVLRHELPLAARHLTGAKVLASRLYGVGPATALAMTCWLGGAGRFSSSRKAVRFAGLDVTVWSSDRKGPPGQLPGRARRCCAGQCMRPGYRPEKGMELKPWQSCIGRLVTTPGQAIALLRDALTILEAQAEYLAATGKRMWEISPGMPALVIIIDEYAELKDEAPDAMSYADSIARLGRALAVTLIAATQRPTQKAMGEGAVRSQMDLRICFRVREPRDVDLILGQGMLRAGWDAHKLNAPGKLLVSAPEHDSRKRARSYEVKDQAVTE